MNHVIKMIWEFNRNVYGNYIGVLLRRLSYPFQTLQAQERHIRGSGTLGDSYIVDLAVIKYIDASLLGSNTGCMCICIYVCCW